MKFIGIIKRVCAHIIAKRTLWFK